MITPGRRQYKTLILSANIDQKWQETDFSIAIGRWQQMAIKNTVYSYF